jgi:signal transduction histidine kinase
MTRQNLGERLDTILVLRWLLVIATSYLLIFSRPLSEVSVAVASFVAGYLASGLVVPLLAKRFAAREIFYFAVVLFDGVAVTVGLTLGRDTSGDFFAVYFIVLFVAAVVGRLGILLVATLLAAGVHLASVGLILGPDRLLEEGYVLRLPFLFAVALFVGYLVQQIRAGERAMEEMREQERLKRELLSSVIHDLKNPLGVIQPLAEMLLAGECGPLTAQQADFIRRIHASVRRVITLSLNLIDGTRIESGRLMLQRSAARIVDVVDEAVALARSASDLKGIDLRVEAEPALPTLDVDVIQIERVIANLLDNAIKYTSPGGSVRVSIARIGRDVVLAVSDNGPGIPPEELPRLWDKYRRQAASGRVGGSGLGLFIVKAIVEAHGGTVAIESRVGEGTTLTVRLPLGVGAAAELSFAGGAA